MFFQQEEYDWKRFLPLIFKKGKLIDNFVTFVLAVVFFVGHSGFLYLVFGLAALRDRRLLKEAKKKLVYTNRVKRILGVSIVLVGVSFMLLSAVGTLGAIIFVHLIPFTLVLGNLLLKPYEAYIQRSFYKDAVSKLTDLNPKIIGITGSYGKTSVKHILSHVLGQAVPTLATPGSINTVMGITRIIRERLEPLHRFFLVEMGAYGIGSIKRLCDFCPPAHGILTAVGCAHYERFKSVEAVAQAKFELFTAVKAKKGFFIVNLDQVDQAFVDKHAGDYDGLVTVSTKGDVQADFFVSDFKEDHTGLTLKVVYQGDEVVLSTPLFGHHHVSNIVQVFALGVKLGVPVATLQAGFRTVPQITHRLEVKKDTQGPIIIDDAYNANPEGFSSALDVLSLLKQERSGRRILVTPGMVELGALHDEKHYELGLKAADSSDQVLIVKSERIPTFVKALDEKKTSYICFHSFAQARQWLQENAHFEDVILYENDLPDLYENKIIL